MSECEILTLDEFAEKVKMSPRAVRKAIRLKQFQPGRHYFVVGKADVRFWWGARLLQALHEDSLPVNIVRADTQPLAAADGAAEPKKTRRGFSEQYARRIVQIQCD